MFSRSRLLLASCILATVLAGCATTPGATTGDTAPETRATPLQPYESALTGVQTPKQYFAHAERIQDAIATCMHEQGFDYTPVDTSKLVSYGTASSHADTAKWAATYGYGINKSPESSTSDSVDPNYINPNDAIVAGLSASEQSAYNVAMTGHAGSTGTPDSDDVVNEGADDAGCQGQAEKANPEADPSEQSQFAGLIEQSLRIPEQIAKDPAVVELDADWASCMADAGYATFTSPMAAQQSIEDDYNSYYGSLVGDADASTVKAMSAKEIETASADFSCRQTVHYTKRHGDVQQTIEQQFVDDNKKDLDALLASYGESTK